MKTPNTIFKKIFSSVFSFLEGIVKTVFCSFSIKTNLKILTFNRISFLIFLFLFKFSFAQINLVQNGSFEQFTHCINTNGEVDSCIGWHAIKNSPDYFNSCTNYFGATVPYNYCGYQEPFEGHAYMGL